MEEWKTYKLGSLCKKVCSGGTPKSTCEEYYGGGIPWLNTKEVDFNRIYSTESTISQAGLDNSSAKWIEENAIIVAMYGNTAGKVALSMIPLTTNQACCNLMVDENKADYRYIYYYLCSQYIQIKSKANGAAQQNLNAQQIKDLDIPLPPLEVQNRIADILSPIDDKIELNNRINHNLEEQMISLFDELCVDIDDCIKAPLTEIADYVNGLAMQKFPATGGEKGLPVLKIKELGQGFFDESSDRCTSKLKPDAIIHDGDIVFSWSGTLLVDMWCGGIGGINQHLFKVQSNKYPKWFYYMWTKYHLENFIHIAKDKAVTMGHIKRGHLENAIVNIPSSEALVALNKIFEPMLEQILKIRLENRKLREERDILLPRLMSGKLTC